MVSKRGPCSINNACRMQTEKSGNNIQNEGWGELECQRLLTRWKFTRSLGMVFCFFFFPEINEMTGSSLAQEITFLEHRKMAGDGFSMLRRLLSLLCGRNASQDFKLVAC